MSTKFGQASCVEVLQIGLRKTVLFAACGITPGTLMEGVRFFHGGARTQSLVISSQSKTARFVDTVHMFGEPQRLQLK